MENNTTDVESVETIDENTPHMFSSPKHFSDVVLVVEGTKFHVHKSTLSMCSPVFEAMFTSQFLEHDAKEIPLPGKQAGEVEQLLKMIYSDYAKQEVTETNYEFLLELAREYQIDKVQQYCHEYMGKGINFLNCLHRYKIAERFDLEDVMEKCNEEASLRSSIVLELSDDFLDLGFESKLKICMTRIKELEKALTEYGDICSELINEYSEAIEQSYSLSNSPKLHVQCTNKKSHFNLFGTDDRKDFDFDCKWCRKRIDKLKRKIAPINAMDFNHLFIKLNDLYYDTLARLL